MRRLCLCRVSASLCLGMLLLSNASAGTPIGTALTYQGQLKHDGLPANMIVDLKFTLHALPEEDAPVGESVEIGGAAHPTGFAHEQQDDPAAFRSIRA